MSPWHAVRIRSDLHRVIQAQAVEQSRSVAGQVDHLLTRALEQTPEPSEGRESSRLTATPVSARASAHEAPAGPQASPPSDVSSSASQGREVEAGVNGGAGAAPEYIEPPPLDLEVQGVRNFAEGLRPIFGKDGIKAQLEGQTDIYEMLGACPECAGAMEQVGDEGPRCVECGYVREG
jgi:hypothetical protein